MTHNIDKSNTIEYLLPFPHLTSALVTSVRQSVYFWLWKKPCMLNSSLSLTIVFQSLKLTLSLMMVTYSVLRCGNGSTHYGLRVMSPVTVRLESGLEFLHTVFRYFTGLFEKYGKSDFTFRTFIWSFEIFIGIGKFQILLSRGWLFWWNYIEPYAAVFYFLFSPAVTSSAFSAHFSTLTVSCPRKCKI